jgi:hypothetical protein
MGQDPSEIRDDQIEETKGREVVRGLATQSPFALALGALAVGFLLGLMMPVTPYERKKLGPGSDEFLDRAQAVGGEMIEHGRAVVEETAQATLTAAQQSAQEHARAVIAGEVEPSALVNSALEHGKAVVRETVETAVQTAQASLEKHTKDLTGKEEGSA